MSNQPQIDPILEEAKKIHRRLKKDETSATFIPSALWDITWLGPIVKLYRKVRYGTRYPIILEKRMLPHKEVSNWKVIAGDLPKVRRLVKKINQDFYRYARKVPKKFDSRQKEKLRVLAAAHELNEYQQLTQEAKRLRKKGKSLREIKKYLKETTFSTHADPSVIIKESNYLYQLGDKDIKNYYKALRAGSGELLVMKRAGLRYGEEYVQPGSRRFKSLVKKMRHYRDLYFPALVSVAYLYPERFIT